MMPHIIYLLLIASSPISTLGDGPESWGSLPSGPSESECRPYIEKALQGASIHESPEQQTAIDDVGDTGESEGSGAPSEASENQSSEISSDEERADISQLQQDTENQNQQDIETDTREKSDITDGELIGAEDSKESEEESVTTEPPSGQTEDLESNETQESSKTEEAEEQSDENKSDETNINIENETNANESDETVETTSIEDDSKEITKAGEEEQTPEEPELPGEEKDENDRSEEVQQNELNEESQEPEIHASEEAPSAEEADTAEDTETSEEVNSETITQPEEQESSVEEEAVPSTVSEPIASEIDGTSEEQSEEEGVPTQESNEPSPSNEQDESPQETPNNTEEISSEETKEEDSAASEIAGTEEKPSEIEENVDSSANDQVAEEESVQSDEVSESSQNLPEIERVEEDSTENRTESVNDENITEEGSASVEEEGDRVEEEPAPVQEEEGEAKSEEPVTSEDTETTEESVTSEGTETSEEPVTPEDTETSEESTAPEEELSMIIEIPEKLRSREHMTQILLLNEENEERENLLSKTIDNTLRELKKLYDNAIKPLEILYKYRDLSNRHFGDPEIFSKPLILFMGPWSGGKSTIINYLLENEYKKTALRSGAEPSPAYFNIVMWGEREEVLDGTQLAADWTFSGLQKFGQGLLDRLRGLKLSHPLLKKVNIVEIPGILEIRKQVERLFPFNDACQWFIDRADIIFLVYDPSKLDVGPETEAILDQLKGREMQTRIILNKADQVKPEELMRVQGTLIWNISPLMSSTEPPVMYSTSLWSLPYEIGAPTRLLHAQERAFLKDLRDAIDKRVENKIASARRFAVRVRNHAKMVDCYLTTYYNHKSFFGNKKKISDDIIEHPQNYHIYEGLSTLTNISRYDLPDPDVYRDFFRLNPVYEFQQLSSTCTYFRGCPINRLDVAIAYDLPELVGKYKKQTEEVLNSVKK